MLDTSSLVYLHGLIISTYSPPVIIIDNRIINRIELIKFIVLRLAVIEVEQYFEIFELRSIIYTYILLDIRNAPASFVTPINVGYMVLVLAIKAAG